MTVVNDVSQLWQSLGTFWADFEDKALIEVIWEAYREVITEKYKDAYQINLSKAFKYMPEYWEQRHQFYNVIYAAEDATYSGLVNTVLISGLHTYYVPSGIFSMPSGLMNTYYQDVDNEYVTETLTEGTDFIIEDYDRITFLNNPPFTADASESNISKGSLYAPFVQLLNPVLFALFGALVDITKDQLKNKEYPAHETGATDTDQIRLDLRHLKFMIWALHYLKRQMPTITNLRRLYGIARGVPFAYVSGLVDSITVGAQQVVAIGAYNYYIPSGLALLVSEGDSVEQFELLVSGIDVYDWYNNQPRILQLTQMDWQEKAILELVSDSSLDSLTYSSTFVSGLIDDVIPKHLTVYFS
jgi:hypothetical protein